MKKNNSFKVTFYLGLIIIVMLVSVLTLIIFNVYRGLESKFRKDKVEVLIENTEPIKEIIHDTVYIDKPTVKSNDTPKSINNIKTKNSPVVSEKIDTVVTTDSIR